MLKSIKALAVIPARGGSKGIPGKNAVSFHGKPLLAWTIMAALETSYFQTVMVSTDSQEIADIAAIYGADVPWLRPDHLADDAATSTSVVLHALSHYDADIVMLLQPTSPLRSSSDIKECLDLHIQTGRPVISVSHAKPWLFTQSTDGSLTPACSIPDQRQGWTRVVPNGAVYVTRARDLISGKTWWDDAIGYVMPAERSVDIDTPLDLEIAKTLFVSPRRQLTEEIASAMVT